MKTVGKCLAALIISLLLQSCTIMYLDVRNNLTPGTAAERNESCNVNYSLSLSSVSHTNTYGVRDTDKDELQKLRNQYTESTKEIFSKKGCTTNYVENEKDANFKIRVVRYRHLSALPQEYLAGLTLFIIPAWGTKEGEYQYTFENVSTKKSHTYYVDQHQITQMFLFPVFWISFITMDEDKVYKEALTNFIEGS